MTTVALTTPSSNDLQVQLKKAQAAIDKKIKGLGCDPAYVPKSPANFKYNELDGNTVNIFSATDLNYLGKSLAKMKRVEREYNATMDELGIKEYPICKWSGVDITFWIQDLTYCTRRLANKTLVDALTQKKNELVQFMSADERLANTLESLKTLMK